MRTIFITPLLWKRLNRSALRRGEEGQAIVLIAFVAIGMVAMVGLAIDSGLGYLESARLQRAADAAALAGVIWLPDNRVVADARAQLAAEANGVKVACYFNNGLADTDPYNQRCRRASYTTVTRNGPDKFFSFDSEAPQGLAIQYKVTLSKMQTRFFLGVLGFPSYPIVRVATAEYYHRVKFGSSFNYYGSNGVLADHYMRCDKANLADCDGASSSVLDMRGATYQKYILMRCDQPDPPSPCVGNFWANIAGQDVFHGNGDAYNPIRDGVKSMSSSSGSVSHYTVNGEVNTESNSSSKGCLHVSDPDTWFVNEILTVTNLSCPPIKNGLAVQNLDTHPDSPLGRKGFGSEVIIDVDAAAIWSYADTISNIANHTNLNVTIYDGAMNEHGTATNFNVGDDYNTSEGNNYAALPPYSSSGSTVNGGYTDWNFKNVTSNNSLTNSSSWDSKRFICSPGTNQLDNTNYCDTASLDSPDYPTAPRATNWDPSKVWTDSYDPSKPWDYTNPADWSNFFPDRNNFELTYNDTRMRYTLYGPPPTPAIPSIYGNVLPYKIGMMEMTDMSAQSRDVQYPIGCPQLGCPAINTGYSSPYESQRFCYFIFDDTKSFWNNIQYPDTKTEARKSPNFGTSSNKYFGPDYAYSTAPTTNSNGVLRAATNRYAYVCPDFPGGNDADVRWNQLKGTPTARYGPMVDYNPNNPGDRTIQKEILDPATTNDISSHPIVENTLITTTSSNRSFVTANSIISKLADPEEQSTSSKQVNIWDVSSTTSSGFKQVVDPQQDCRRSAVDMSATSTDYPGFPMDAMWGHNRIPFNMAYGDPLVNRAWITSTTWLSSNPSNPVSSKKIAGYYTLYYSFHGWRCDWDFDSNYTYDPNTGRGNPLKDPTKMPSAANPSLSLQERLNWGSSAGNYGKYDKAFVEGHPGLNSITYTKNVLTLDGASATNAKRDFPVDSAGNSITAGFDRDFGLQPYFHMTNIAWNPDGSSSLIPAPGFTPQTAPVRGGSYMLHVQSFAGAFANQYSVKAEYENPKPVTYTTASGTLTVMPVPSVYPLTTMSIFANAGNASVTKDVVFDLAFIPPEYAGTQGIVQLWDPGDVNGTLSVSILQPSTYGPKINSSGGSSPSSWSVSLGAAITTTISACPLTLSPATFGTNYPCVFNSSQTPATAQTFTYNNNRYYNGQWVFLGFKIPSLVEYNAWKASCEVNGVPETLCYYFQIDYKLTNALPTDVTTWQLLVQGQPVHLVDNES